MRLPFYLRWWLGALIAGAVWMSPGQTQTLRWASQRDLLTLGIQFGNFSYPRPDELAAQSSSEIHLARRGVSVSGN